MRILVKIKNLIIRFFAGVRILPEDISLFGPRVAFMIFWDKLFPPGKSSLYINTIYKYSEKFCLPIAKKYNSEFVAPEAKKQLSKNPVWVCWWQGEETMPPIVKTCFKILNRRIPENFEVHLITLNNYREYIDFPKCVEELFSEGKMTFTELSNVLRFELLARYGGLWIDSTVYLTDNLPNEFYTEDFYGQKMTDDRNSKHEPCRGMWSGFLIRSSKNGIIPCYLRECYELWWQKYDKVIDYVDFDYFLLVAYNNLPQVKQLIDSVTPNNENIFGLVKVLNDEFSEEKFEEYKKTNVLHKLSYKGRLTEKTADGKETFYGHILKEYIDE